MTAARMSHAAALLRNGKVLIAGGATGSGDMCLASAELYDEASGTFSPTGSMATTRAGTPAVVLKDGRVLIAGGYYFDADGNTVALASAELYDPAHGTFSATGSMAEARYGHTATLLEDGRVLVAGGTKDRGPTLASAELYDPQTGSFSPTGWMTTARVGHTATLLENGLVLLAGGSRAREPANPTYLDLAELYDPAHGTFSATGSMAEARYGHTATLLEDGRVLVAGGMTLGEGGVKASLASAELYDPANAGFSSAGSMASPRGGHVALVLADGRLLIAGGSVYDPLKPTYLSSAELYPGGAFTPASSMTVARFGGTATLLKSGRVLIAGGGDSETILASAELYQP
jgi:hypothetical protein